jgi:membrane-associated phospholipid phosphatase
MGARSELSCPGKDCESPLSNAGTASVPAKDNKDTVAQETPPDTSMTLKKMFVNLPGDQKAIWTSPFRMRLRDSLWVAPMIGATGVLIGSDRHSMERARSNTDATKLSDNVSTAGAAAMVGLPVLMYAWGARTGNSRERETGLLSGEALLNSLAFNEVLKIAFQRRRPDPVGGAGKFFSSGIGDSSFPSNHSILSWTAASVIAHEYPGPLTQALVYGAATAVSVSRVTGRKHFPSDVVVGAAAGWLIGRHVFNAHHDPDLDGSAYGAFTHEPDEFDASKLGSTFVPLDSWVYPALERLAALGYIKMQFIGLRPWTRRECLRQIEEAEFFAGDLSEGSEVAATIKALREEFKRDGQRFETFSVDSIYTGYANISGAPLRDSYHIGQTIWNDYGRAYEQGSNIYTGGSVSAVAGRFFMYARGEFQHVPGRAGLTSAQQTFVNCNMDGNCGVPGITPPLPGPVSGIDRFYPNDMYAGIKLGEYAFTFGKQSLWLGPGESGPLMLSNNADPMYMVRLTRTTPLILPSFLRHLGEIRSESIFGKLSGHQFPQRPFFNLQKISIHPTQNLEIGFTRASVWAGVGHPFTAHSLGRNFTSIGDTFGGYGDPTDPGDRKSGFDFSYRLPGLRNWLTLYSDFYSDDDPSPLANPRRAAINPGLYLSHVPGVSKLDLRVEAVSTQALTATDRGGTFFYYNTQYHDANTNKGYLFGNQTGRDGRTYQAWTTYHFSAATSLQFSYRDTKASSQFIPRGGTQSDASTRLLWQVRPNWSVDAFVQYERWLIPFLHPTAQQDVTGRIQLTYTPRLKELVTPKK